MATFEIAVATDSSLGAGGGVRDREWTNAIAIKTATSNSATGQKTFDRIPSLGLAEEFDFIVSAKQIHTRQASAICRGRRQTAAARIVAHFVLVEYCSFWPSALPFKERIERLLLMLCPTILNATDFELSAFFKEIFDWSFLLE